MKECWLPLPPRLIALCCSNRVLLTRWLCDYIYLINDPEGDPDASGTSYVCPERDLACDDTVAQITQRGSRAGSRGEEEIADRNHRHWLILDSHFTSGFARSLGSP